MTLSDSFRDRYATLIKADTEGQSVEARDAGAELAMLVWLVDNHRAEIMLHVGKLLQTEVTKFVSAPQTPKPLVVPAAPPFPKDWDKPPVAAPQTAAVVAAKKLETVLVKSRDYWTCDVPTCASADLEYSLIPTAIPQSAATLFVPYKCCACGAEGNAYLNQIDITEMLAVQQPVVNIPIGEQRQVSAPVEAPAIPPAPNATRRRRKAEPTPAVVAAPVPVTPSPIPKATNLEPVSAETQALVARILDAAPSEVDNKAVIDVFTVQVRGWPLDKVIKEWEAMTGKTYTQGKTDEALMVAEIVNQMAGVPVNA